MEKSMELLLSRLDEKLNRQAELITVSVTKSVMEALDDRIKVITEENDLLKSKVSTLEHKLNLLEREKRKYNLVFFGIEQIGNSEAELVDHLKDIVLETGTHLDSQEISNVYRIGKNKNQENRPVVVTIASLWKKHMILKNKAKLPPGIRVKEDFPKEVLETRKQLQLQVEEERKKGNLAFLRYDRIIVKKPTDKTREKRKREDSGSPKLLAQKQINTRDNLASLLTKGKGIIKPNKLNYVERNRSASLSDTPKN